MPGRLTTTSPSTAKTVLCEHIGFCGELTKSSIIICKFVCYHNYLTIEQNFIIFNFCCYRETGEDDGPEVQIVDEVINVERKRREAVDLVHDDLLKNCSQLTTIKPELDDEMLTTTTTAEPDLEPETTTVEAEPEMETTTALTLESYIDRVNKSSLNFPFIRTTFKEMGERRPDVVPPTFISWLDMASSKL